MCRNIRINPVLNGFVVEVGCQTVVINNTAQLAAEIKRYYDNPDQVEKEYRDRAINKTLEEPQNPCNVRITNADYAVPEGAQALSR